MKKSLLALAILASAATVPAVSYAASSVSVYGLIDSYVSVNNDSGNVSSGLHSGGSSGSYFGFKGTEDLGLWGVALRQFLNSSQASSLTTVPMHSPLQATRAEFSIVRHGSVFGAPSSARSLLDASTLLIS